MADWRNSMASMSKASKTIKFWLREWWWIILLGLIVQGLWALRLEHPAYFDAYYYTTNAQRLAEGHGFSEEIVWQYLDHPEGLPTPSHTYWMPLASMVGAAGFRVGGSFRAAQAPFWLMAALLPLLGYTISWQLFGRRWQARAAALFTMTGGYYAAYWVQPTTFAPFAWAGGGCLLALALARRSVEARGGWWLIAGLGAGLAHLTRADGLLILAVAGAMWFLQAIESRRAQRALPWRAAAMLALGYLAIMAPWFYRTWQVTGQPLSTVGTQTIFLTIYDDIFSYGRQFDLQQYLEWGWRNILLSKVKAAWLALQTYVVVIGLTAFSFFAVLAWIAARRRTMQRRFLQPATWYAVLLFVAMSFVFTFPGQRGSLLHSSTVLWPWSMALVPAGIDSVVEWIADRRPRWRPRTAKRFFTVTFVLMALAISVVVASDQPLNREEAAIYRETGAMLPPGTVVMTGDPPGFYYHSRLPAIATPNEPPPGMLSAARQFGASYLLMDMDLPVPLRALREGDAGAFGLQPVHDFGEGFQLFRLPPALPEQEGE